MIAKIGRGSNIYGALNYNLSKIHQNAGTILHLNNMFETPSGEYTTPQLLSSFMANLAANKKTEKTAIHISLNPDPIDIISDENYVRIAEEYMRKMGYSDQPYVVFRHNDIDRSHIHIVSTTVDKNGIKISDVFEKRRSMEICRNIEKKYNLAGADEKKSFNESLTFQPVDHTKGNIKSQISAVVRYISKYYYFQSLGSYNALLSLFNIAVEPIKKEYNGDVKEGLMYFALDKNGEKVTNPFKASLFGKQAGLLALQTHFIKSKELAAETKEKSKNIIAQAISIARSEKDFKEYLIDHGINLVIRRNDQGRLYGISFIDHNSRNVFNGSHLGKEFSANSFNALFSSSQSPIVVEYIDDSQKKDTSKQSRSANYSLHPLFDFMINNGSVFSDWGLLDQLLLHGITEDPEEHLFEFNMKKKRKRKR
ncbi:conjugal transfer protein MobB [Sphingobacterium sp. 40-24]|uniref:conjugal transfer protein MobB n=1 Tax=Sphingobacterium sp. 40-24 TaxID=1895843 RepID=UPI00095D3D19|nr:conjugal transfer protein MobB [Sphingobacterium sp. 40-24]OJZ01192.1 MAG: relaxase [Sphingobacterium sp. 40-24]